MAVSVRLTDGRVLQIDDEPVGTGAEKRVFLTRDRQYAVGFYYGALSDRRERVDRLTRILTNYNPTLATNGAYWLPSFCWPVGMVDGEGAAPLEFARRQGLVWPPLAVVTPTYRSNFYFTDRFGGRQEKEVRWFTGGKASRFVPPAETGSLLTRLQIGVRLARAVRRLHMAGLAHADLSNKNVLVDPKGGDACIIDIDSLVVPGVAPPAVLGTPGYIAPEVLANKAQPSIATDKHALAVLLYELLLERHPLQGKRVNSPRSAEEDETLSMGARALFVEHPTDRSNPSVKPITVPYTRLGPYLARCFSRTFVDGLHAPVKRADAAEWELALYRTMQLLHPLPSGAWTIVAPGLPLASMRGEEALAGGALIARNLRDTGHAVVDEGDMLVLWHHLRLHDWHLRSASLPDERADRTPRGYVAQHGGAWLMVNTSETSWHVNGALETTGNGAAVSNGERVVGRNQSVELVPGLQVRIGDSVPARVLRIETLR
ncbi:MAG TPA: lipopolysaccharide kinase InaA family protein [Gemmatimonas sp.]|nr:lipopolysaccharide kinase InaA family protein [Gemmatimonas sp.]